MPVATSEDVWTPPLVKDAHRLRLRIEDGYLRCDLICPEDGRDCVSSTICGVCGRDALGDSETVPCYDCPPPEGSCSCWLRTWVDDLAPYELLSGVCVRECGCRHQWSEDEASLKIVGEAECTDAHRLRLRIEDGELSCGVICPQDHEVARVCVACGRALPDDKGGCYLCRVATAPNFCWLQAAASALAVDELLAGEIEFEVAIAYRWDGFSEVPVVQLLDR